VAGGPDSVLRQGELSRQRCRDKEVAFSAAFEVRYECPALFSPTPQAAARQIEKWAFYYSREVVETVNNLWRAGAI
jgi:hypothetical protein